MLDKLAVVQCSATSLDFLVLITIVLIHQFVFSSNLSQLLRDWCWLLTFSKHELLSHWDRGILKKTYESFFGNILAIENTNIGGRCWDLLLE